MEPRFRGGKVIFARSFARIHETNLKKQGVLALTFADPADLRRHRRGRPHQRARPGRPGARHARTVRRSTRPDGTTVDFAATHTMNDEQIEWFKAGSALNIIRRQARELTGPAADLPPARLLGIDHVQLAMPPGEAAEADADRFYGGVLGLTRVPKPAGTCPAGGCWFEAPSRAAPPRCARTTSGPPRKAHPALLVDDIDAVCQHIVAAGGEVRPRPTMPGIRRLHTDDPFGNRIELIQAVGPSFEAFETMAEHSIFPLADGRQRRHRRLDQPLGRAVLRLGPRRADRPQLRQGDRAPTRWPA